MPDAGAESPPSIQFPWLDRHDFYRSGLPTRTLAGSFRERDPKSCADAQDLLAPFGNPDDVPFRNSGITRSDREASRMRKNEIEITRNGSVISNHPDGVVCTYDSRHRILKVPMKTDRSSSSSKNEPTAARFGPNTGLNL